MNIWETSRGHEIAGRLLIALENIAEPKTKEVSASYIERCILNFIATNYGSQERDDPCYNIEALAAEIAEKVNGV